MDTPKRPRRKLRQALLLAALALLCVGGAELAACYHFAPDTYARITAPVRAALSAAGNAGQATVSGLSAWYAELRAPAEEDNASQQAEEPILENTAPVLDPAITELVSEGDRAVLTGGILPVVYFRQSDPLWDEQPYGSDTIGRYGCGPTAMAMAVASLTGEAVDPAQMAQAAVDAGHWARRQGSYLSIVEGLAAEYGLSAQPLADKTVEGVRDALLSGHLLVALMGPGHFTSGGHFILIRGITLQGTLLVADPNSVERSLQPWEPQLLLDELASRSANGAPLWVLSCGG